MLSAVWIIVYLVFPFLGSVVVASLILRYQHLHDKATADCDLESIQKFHTVPVPRIGGIPIAFAMLMGGLVLEVGQQGAGKNSFYHYTPLMFSGALAFAAGLLEDLTKKVGPIPRLLITFVAASFAFNTLGVKIDRMAIPIVDAFLLAHPWAVLSLTVFVVGGVCHAFNIIDGYNGLASGSSLIILLALSTVACQLNDLTIAIPCLILMGGIAGFLVFNFPCGRLFLGDGGAYLIGFMISVLSILLGNRHPENISPWFPMLLVIYPVFETVFSICRRKSQGRAVGLPDRGHLHQLIFLRLVRWKTTSHEAEDKILRNSLTSPYLWGLTAMTAMPAIIFYNSTLNLSVLIIGFMVFYLWFYRRIVRFRVPRWMILSSPNGNSLIASAEKPVRLSDEW